MVGVAYEQYEPVRCIGEGRSWASLSISAVRRRIRSAAESLLRGVCCAAPACTCSMPRAARLRLAVRGRDRPQAVSRVWHTHKRLFWTSLFIDWWVLRGMGVQDGGRGRATERQRSARHSGRSCGCCVQRDAISLTVRRCHRKLEDLSQATCTRDVPLCTTPLQNATTYLISCASWSRQEEGKPAGGVCSLRPHHVPWHDAAGA